MVDVGLWIALEATIGFIVGLGLASLMGQRTVPVILLVVLELILTPHLQPPRDRAPAQRRAGDRRRRHAPYRAGRPADAVQRRGSGGGGGRAEPTLIPESTLVASLVIVGWIVFWTAIGAWRMMTRDA